LLNQFTYLNINMLQNSLADSFRVQTRNSKAAVDKGFVFVIVVVMAGQRAIVMGPEGWCVRQALAASGRSGEIV